MGRYSEIFINHEEHLMPELCAASSLTPRLRVLTSAVARTAPRPVRSPVDSSGTKEYLDKIDGEIINICSGFHVAPTPALRWPVMCAPPLLLLLLAVDF